MKKLINNIKIATKGTDFIFLLLCLITSAFGCLMVYSATRIDIAENEFISRDARTMILAVAIGLVLSLIISFVDYKIIIRFAPAIAVVCIGLMVATLIWGVGPAERQDAKTWIMLGSSGLYFQPSELVKIGFIITFGIHLELVEDKLREVKHILLLCVHGAIPIGLVVISGDMGSALVFILIFVVMMFCAGIQLRYFILAGTAVIASVPVAWTYLLSSTQKDRFLALIYPDLYEDIIYQQEKGMQAIGSGGFFGQGLFKGMLTQAGVVPESENDMIFTVVGEELGFLGCVVAIALLVMIAVRATHTGNSSHDSSTSLMCYGFSTMILSQAVINIGMCLKLLPVVGITLPFFSAGGSSNLCIYIGAGLIMSIYRYNKDLKSDTFNFNYLNYSISKQ